MTDNGLQRGVIMEVVRARFSCACACACVCMCVCVCERVHAGLYSPA